MEKTKKLLEKYIAKAEKYIKNADTNLNEGKNKCIL